MYRWKFLELLVDLRLFLISPARLRTPVAECRQMRGQRIEHAYSTFYGTVISLAQQAVLMIQNLPTRALPRPRHKGVSAKLFSDSLRSDQSGESRPCCVILSCHVRAFARWPEFRSRLVPSQ